MCELKMRKVMVLLLTYYQPVSDGVLVCSGDDPDIGPFLVACKTLRTTLD